MDKNYFSGFCEGTTSPLINLIIYDSEYTKSSKKYYELAEELHKVYKSYFKTLKELSGKLEGNFADNMSVFAEKIDFYLNDSIKCTYKTLKSNMNSYISEIDDADGKLF